MNLKEINQIRLRQKEVEKYTRINIIQNCTDDEILDILISLWKTSEAKEEQFKEI